MTAILKVGDIIVERLVRSNSRKNFRKILVSVFRLIARQSWAIPFLTTYVASKLKPLCIQKSSISKMRLLVLNEERYRPDLEMLGEDPHVELVSLPSSVQHLLNAIWISDVDAILQKDRGSYFRNDNPEIEKARVRLFQFMCKFIKELAKREHIDGIASCTFYYLQDREWEAAGRAVGVPFFALHKENMKDPVIHEASIERYRNSQYKFVGNRIFLFNKLEREVLLKAKVCGEQQISVVGGLRMDGIFHRLKNACVPKPKRQVVLFSFHHCVGLLKIPGLKGFFNDQTDEGFIEYFDQVHGAMAALARDYPDITVYIKPKWSQQWIDQIKMAIDRNKGINADNISNLKITAEVPAQCLIEQSAVIVGINSTTLLEAKLYNRPVVVPLFAEAAGKYYDKHVYFQNYLEVFNVVRSMNDLIPGILAELEGAAPIRKMPKAMVEDYLGFFDGKTCQRVTSLMAEDIQLAKTQRGW